MESILRARRGLSTLCCAVLPAVVGCGTQDQAAAGPGGTGQPDASDTTGDATCQSVTCAAIGAQCGSSSDGCGKMLDCGTCASPQVCSNHQCSTAAVWSVVDPGTMTGSVISDIWGVGGTLWGSGSFGSIWTYAGGEWSSQELFAVPLVSVQGTSAQDVWAGGPSGTLVQFDGSSWSLQTTSAAGYDIHGIWPDGTGKVWIAEFAGFRSWDGSNWGANYPTAATVRSLWGGSPNDLWGVGDQGAIYHWLGSEWTLVDSPTIHTLYRLWGRGSNDIWAVGESAILHYDGTAWQDKTAVSTGTLWDIWGGEDGVVWAVGVGGAIWHGSATDGFQLIPSPTSLSLFSIWGTSSVDIWAVGDAEVKLHYGPQGGGQADSGVQCSPWGESCVNVPCCPGLDCLALDSTTMLCGDLNPPDGG